MQKMQEIQGIAPALLDFWQEKSGKPSHEKTSQFRKNPFPSPQELPPVQPKDLWYNGRRAGIIPAQTGFSIHC